MKVRVQTSVICDVCYAKDKAQVPAVWFLRVNRNANPDRATASASVAYCAMHGEKIGAPKFSEWDGVNPDTKPRTRTSSNGEDNGSETTGPKSATPTHRVARGR